MGGQSPLVHDDGGLAVVARSRRRWRDIQAVMQEVGAAKTVLAIYFRNPYVLDDESRLERSGSHSGQLRRQRHGPPRSHQRPVQAPWQAPVRPGTEPCRP